MSGQVFKSLLNQYCQKARVSLPVYKTKTVQTVQGIPCYTCKVKLFNGASFESQGAFSNKKSAEQNAAEHALNALGQIAGPAVQKTGRSVTETCHGTPESIPAEETSSSNKNTAINSDNTVTIASTSGGILSPMQTVTQPKLTILPKLNTAKNVLNERAQKLRLRLPLYQTEADSQGVGFISRVTFNGVTYCSNGSFIVKKQAEKSAAQEALKVLLLQDDMESCRNVTSGTESSRLGKVCGSEENKKNVAVPTVAGMLQGNSSMVTPVNQEVQINIQGSSSSDINVPGPSSIGLYSPAEMPTTPTGAQIVSESVSQPSPVSFKNLLQEYMQQRGIITGPKYETSMADFGLFKSTVHFCGKTIESTQGFPTKKQAEQMVARQALLDLGVEEPEKLATSRKAKDRTRKLGSLKRKHLQGPGDMDFNWDSSPNLTSRLRKRRKLDENMFAPTNLKLQSPPVEKALGHVDFLSVGEIWKEKKNVAIIGNDQTSFVLHCTRVDSSLQILNTRIMENVELKQGYRIIGLDADFVQRQGRLILESERCADIEIPEKPDPVLISCGVVVLHLDPNDSSNTEILLKRYTNSQAFINVKAALAQFFRRSVSGHPFALPVTNLTEHIQHWALEEVGYIAAMDVPAMQQVFLNFWKFKDSWSSVLEPALPKDLKDLQTRAQEELSRRISSGANTDDASSYPWGLPKGNFRHRMLSTGLHIEKPSECAARELREETGIQVDPSDLEKISYVDIPQDDNLNPHKGDVSRYFLYTYNPIIEELNSQSEVSLQSDQSVGASEDVTGDTVLPVLARGEQIESKDEESEYRKDEGSNHGGHHTPLTESCQATRELKLGIASLSEKLFDSSSKETEEESSNIKEDKTEMCSAVPSPLSSPSSLSSSSSSENKNVITAAKESGKESLNSFVGKNPCISSCISMSSPSLSTTTTATTTTTAAAKSSPSNTKKKTPLNTDFETEKNSSENSNFPLIKSDPVYPTMPCKSTTLDIDSEVRNESIIQEDTGILDSTKDNDLESKGIPDAEQENISKDDDASSEIHYGTESCSYQVKRGQKRKRGSCEDEESGGEDDRPVDAHQRPGTSTPAADTDQSRYQSPIVQGAKHEECSWFPIEEALKISPTFATIYKTEKFSELLTLIKTTWT